MTASSGQVVLGDSRIVTSRVAIGIPLGWHMSFCASGCSHV